MAKNKPTPKPAAEVKQPSATAKPAAAKGGFLKNSKNQELLFNKTNYIIAAVGVLLIILGFVLMSGGNTDPKVFNEAEIYSFRRITLAPIVVLSGFGVIILAILKKPSPQDVA